MGHDFEQLEDGLFIGSEYVEAFKKMGLDSLETIFQFDRGRDLVKSNLAPHRNRCVFELEGLNKTVYMKRYDSPGKKVQLKSWAEHGRKVSLADCDRLPGRWLSELGILSPKIVAYGSQWEGIFEKRSFIITQEIPGGVSLEKQLPSFFGETGKEAFNQRKDFIYKLADLARTFHESGLRHRDFYLSHFFLDSQGRIYLIDLHRTFVPTLLKGRFKVKDIAQLHYSCPGDIITNTDRIRFYKRYMNRDRLDSGDRSFIIKVRRKAWCMADHDIKHGREVPFAR